MRKTDLGAIIPLLLILIMLISTWLGLWGPVGPIGDKERTGLVKWLYDWQQMISGFLALVGAAATIWLFWRQIKDTRRQAIAAERQAMIATEDMIGRRVASVHGIGVQVRELTNLIADLDLTVNGADLTRSLTPFCGLTSSSPRSTERRTRAC